MDLSSKNQQSVRDFKQDKQPKQSPESVQQESLEFPFRMMDT